MQTVSLSSSQSAELRRLGAKCYSPTGQTRLIWPNLPEWASANLWLRFHFFQASVISWMFLFLDVSLITVILIDWMSGASSGSLQLLCASLGLFIFLHAILFTYLAQYAQEGHVMQMPIVGHHAAVLAEAPKRLEEFKFFC